MGKKKIESTLGIEQFKGEPVEYQLFYNDSYIESNGLNVLADFAETFDQRTLELGQKQFDRWEAFWEIVSGRQDSSIIQKISVTFSWFKGVVSDLVSQGMNTMIRELLQLLLGSSNLVFFCKIEKPSFVVDDWIAIMKLESYLLLSLITDSAPLIKAGNFLLFKLKCQSNRN